MARPIAQTPTVYPKARGSALYIIWIFRGLQHRHATGIKTDPTNVGVNGFIKKSDTDHIDKNNQLQDIIDRYQRATALLVAKDTLSVEYLKREYDRLEQEDKAKDVLSNIAQLQQQQQVNTEHYLSESAKMRERVKKAVRIPTADQRIEEASLSIEQLEALLQKKKLERDHELRLLNQYDDDLLSTFLNKYKSRKGSATMEDSSQRVVDSFIKTLDRFNANWKIQDVNEQSLIAFQDWLIAEGKVNSTIENYTTKIKSCLNYYTDRPALLPAHVILTKDYKNYSCDLTQKPEHVIALSPAEIHDLLLFNNYRKKSWEKIRDVFVLLCATGCRISDAMKINPTFIKNGNICFTPKKTKKKVIQVTIPLNPLSTHILQKYDWDMTKVKLEDYYLNEQIKIIAELVGGSFNIEETVINHSGNMEIPERKKRYELLTSHCGRRTYSTLRAAQGANVAQLMGETGHTDPKTLMLYVNKQTQRIEQPFALPLLLN